MEKIKKARGPTRTQVSRTLGEVEAELGKEEPNLDLLEKKMKLLHPMMAKLEEFDDKVMDAMVQVDTSEDELLKEHDGCHPYRERYVDVQHAMEKIHRPAQCPALSTISNHSNKKTYKLPKWELRKFSGDLTDWLSWWSQFKKIHNDEEIEDCDKFQYLIQSMVPGSRARELVESYPMTSTNYPKAISSLKERFGRDHLLVEVYVRELLKMVISNVCKKDKVDILKIFDKLESHLRALDSLGVTTDKCAAMLYPIVESSLPEELMRTWQRSQYSGNMDRDGGGSKSSLDYLMEFLRQEVMNEERIALARNGFGIESKDRKSKSSKYYDEDDCPTAAGLFSGQKDECGFCGKSNHPTVKCFRAKQMSLDEKMTKIRQKKLCYCCLKSGHNSMKCRTGSRCDSCQKNHHPILCPQFNQNQKEDTAPAAGMSNQACRSDVLLQTELVKLYWKGKSRIVRLVYDSGSQLSFVRREAMKSLGVSNIGEEWLNNCLFGGMMTGPIKHYKYSINISSPNSENQFKLDVLDKDDICGKICRIPNGPWINELKQMSINLSDFSSPSEEIELLIGSDHYGKLMTGKVVHLKNGLTAFQSVFGWSLGGKLPKDNYGMMVTSLFLSNMDESQMWDLETIGIRDPAEHKTREEKDEDVRKHFLESVCREEDGRYSVSLPWIDGRPQIPSNRPVAEKRLVLATEKIVKAGYYAAYEEVFNSWEKEGIIEEVSDDDFSDTVHYLPHRAVIKPESLTTPIRPVFDASCKQHRIPSLNECLEKGPNLLEMIPDVLLRFRRGKIGVSSDIRKAFLQIKVKKEDRNHLRFLWWKNYEKKEFKIYRHQRVVFGVNSSPYLLAAVIELHLQSVPEEDRVVAEKLWKSLYVDNCLTTVNNEEELEHFRNNSVKIMADAKMELRQWEWSHQEGGGVTSVLGMKWNKSEDTLGYPVEELKFGPQITKREVLSCYSKFYDPLGYLCPALLQPKLVMRDAWVKKVVWNGILEDELSNRFKKWVEETPSFKNIWIERNAFGHIKPDSIQIHTFTDASKSAYAAAVFLRIVENGIVRIQLLQAKSRVSPIKLVSIPRLELLGCLIGARLTNSLKNALSLDQVRTLFWTDSSTALAWIRRNDLWGRFVGNRVKEILQHSKEEQWRHVPGHLNPADLPSRGCSPKELADSRWWEGPQWLLDSEELWQKEKLNVDEDAVSAEKLKTVTTTMSCLKSRLTDWKFSSFRRNVNVMAWILRYIDIKLKKPSRNSDVLTIAELEEAELTLARIIQYESFRKEDTKIANLRVVRGADGLIRVKTKLLMRDDLVPFKTPILLPQKHLLVEQLIRKIHLDNCHAGIQFIMGKLREKYWIINSRKAIRRIVSSCVKCRRFSGQAAKTVDVALPEDRVKNAAPFEITGVDLAGPLFLKGGSKVWVVLYTCAVYRCVHLELVRSLSTEAFLMSFHRFIDRRGTPKTIYSDNGTNFVGASNLFNSVDWTKVGEKARERRIIWKFNPPTAAWWGGWWERLIGLMKGLLRRILGQEKLSYEELLSMLIKVESVLNNRPLTVVTEDPSDLIPLTPSMFLFENSSEDSAEMETLDCEGLNKRLKFVRTIRLELKSRFRKEYLALLVQRGSEKATVLNVGDVVLVGSDGIKRQNWPMGRIVKLVAGRDGEYRSALIKTELGEILRPVQRLYHMEVSSGSS